MSTRTITTFAAKLIANTREFFTGMDAAKAKAQKTVEAVEQHQAKFQQAAQAAGAASRRNVEASERERKAQQSGVALLRQKLEQLAPITKQTGMLAAYFGGMVVTMNAIVRGALSMRNALDGAGRAAQTINSFGSDFGANIDIAGKRLNQIAMETRGIYDDNGAVRVLKETGKAVWDLIPGTAKFAEALREEEELLTRALNLQTQLAAKERERAAIKEATLRLEQARAADAERGAQLNSEGERVFSRRDQLSDQIESAKAEALRRAARAETDANKRAEMEKQAAQIETAIRVEQLRRQLAKETEVVAQEMLRERIRQEEAAGREAIDEIERERKRAIADRRSGENRLEQAIEAISGAPLLVAGTAEAQAFNSQNPVLRVQEAQLKANERAVELLDRIERNTTGQDVLIPVRF